MVLLAAANSIAASPLLRALPHEDVLKMAQKLRSEMLKVILIGMKPIGITMSVKLATLFATTLMLS